MGLLDEAIRDHLELKRRRGANPSEIARAEQEALEPIFPPEDGDEPSVDGAGEQQPESATAVDAGVEATQAWEEEPAAAGYDLEATAAPLATDETNLGQDTAEIDMEAVLQADGADEAPIAERSPDEELLEWEIPARAAHEPAGEPPAGVEYLGDAASADGSGAGDPDTQIPGQERISFE